MNIIEAKMKEGKIKNIDDLKAFYRSVVKKIHPDVNNDYRAQELFLKIRDDYFTALENFESKIYIVKKYNRIDCLYALTDLLVVNFPQELSDDKTSSYYKKKYYLFLKEFSCLGEEYKKMFGCFHNEYLKIRVTKDRDNYLLSKQLEAILNLIRSNYFFTTKVTVRSIDKDYKDIKNLLEKNNYDNSIRFLDWLIQDFKRNGTI